MTEDTTALQDKIAQLEAELNSAKEELKTLTKENATLQEQLQVQHEQSPEGLKELAARAQADLQNAKERMEREAREIRQYALEGTIQKLLPTIDNFTRAFTHLPEELQSHEWVKGVQAVENDLLKMLQEAGLKKIESIGQTIDTNRHEVLQMGPGTENTVTDVFEDGYELNGRILRPAKVKVGDGS